MKQRNFLRLVSIRNENLFDPTRRDVYKRQVVDDRQIVDIIETEYFLQFQGNHSQRVGIVTLSGIKRCV